MERRIKARGDVRTEDYLERFPELRANEEQLLEVVLLEYRLRKQFGLDSDAQELPRRFPELAQRLPAELCVTAFAPPNVEIRTPATAHLEPRVRKMWEKNDQGTSVERQTRAPLIIAPPKER